MRIALIHALKHSIAPIEDAFARIWPDATIFNLLDDSLSADLAAQGSISHDMTQRFLTLAHYAAGTGADGILFTCSAFGSCIETCAQELYPLPVLKPNEAMIREAESKGNKIGLLASFAPTLESMPKEFPSNLVVVPKFAQGALTALDQANLELHDELAACAALDLMDCDVIALAQFSLARAQHAVAAKTGKPVLTTPDCAVHALHSLLTS
jgi:Asp/Glu/hydantoin racemase